MTIRHLKIFITIVECGTMHKAAKKLFISQPSISQSISELETHYGIKLFERISQRLRLTKQGELLLPYAKQAVETFDKIDELMKSSSTKSKIRIGASVTVGTFKLNDYITLLETKIPNIDVEVVVNNTSTIEKLLRNCDIDIAIVEGLVTAKDIIKKPLFEDELVIICGKNHPFYDKKYVEVEDLRNQEFISREQGSSERNQFENFLCEHDITINRKWICSNVDAIKNAVIEGRGLAIISRLMIKKEIIENTLIIVPIKKMHIKRNIHLIYHKDKHISKELKTFISVCDEITKKQTNL